jgi:ABC-type glycerol-3-phosphate transport system permease component
MESACLYVTHLISIKCLFPIFRFFFDHFKFKRIINKTVTHFSFDNYSYFLEKK